MRWDDRLEIFCISKAKELEVKERGKGTVTHYTLPNGGAPRHHSFNLENEDAESTGTARSFFPWDVNDDDGNDGVGDRDHVVITKNRQVNKVDPVPFYLYLEMSFIFYTKLFFLLFVFPDLNLFQQWLFCELA